MRKNLIAASLLVGALGLFAFWTARTWASTLDDAFIFFRYARNLASGAGLTFNPGCSPAEGYTSILYNIVLVAPHLLHWDAVVFAKVLGIISILATAGICVAFVYKSTGFLEPPSRVLAGAASALAFLAFPETAIHANSGMDTAIFTVILTAFFFCAACLVERPTRGSTWLLAVLGLLVGLTRPEGNLLVIAAVLIAFILLPPASRKALFWSALLAYVLPGLAYFLWRWRYFGVPLPLPFYLKVTGQALGGRGPVVSFLFAMMPLVAAFAILGLRKAPRSLWPGIVAAAIACLFYVYPVHIMGFAYRLLFPLAPMMVVVCGVGLGWLLNAFLSEDEAPSLATGRRPFQRPRGRTIATFAGIMLLLAMTAAKEGMVTVRLARSYAAGMEQAHVLLGRLLARMEAASGAPVLAIGDAGAVPYYSNWKTVDIFGLNDPGIARMKKGDPSYIEYVFAQDPSVVVLISKSRDVFVSDLREAPLQQACLQRGMRLVGTLEFEANRYYLWVYARPGSRIASELEKNLAQPS